jgi:tetratricopeptide (TPR) repeat protein
VRQWLLAAAVLLAPALAHAQSQAGRVLIMPFENIAHENRIVWLGEAAAVLLADEFTALGANAISRDERRQAFEQLQAPRAAALTDATVIRLGELVGASKVVVGTLRLDGDTLVVRARAIAIELGKLERDVTERGNIPDLFPLFERVARQLAPDGAARPARPHPPIAAFENYIKGLVSETPPTAVVYLNAALKADQTLDRARLALWDVHTEQGDHTRALAAATAIPPTSPLAARAAFLAGLSQLSLQRYDDAFATFKGLGGGAPPPAVLNNLGVVQMRRGSNPQTGQPTYYFNKAAEADGVEPDYFFNLGYAYWSERDLPAAIYWLREAVRRNPADGDAHYVLGAALAGVGSATESRREKELARRLSSTYAEWDRRPAATPVPRGLERIKRGIELPRMGRLEEALATGQRDQQELARFYLERARRHFELERDRDALADATRALFLSPYLPEAHLLVGRVHLRAERVREAIDALKIALWSAESAEAHAALAAALARVRDTVGARAEAARALALDPASSEAHRVLEALPPP